MTGILCATDFSPAANQATQIAGQLARALDAPLRLLHVIHVPSPAPPEMVLDLIGPLHAAAERRLGGAVTELCAQGVKAEGRLESGPVEALIQGAIDDWRPDLVVLGHHGRRGVARFLGSLAERLLRRAEVPLLLVPENPVVMLDWRPGERPLEVTAAVDTSAASRAVGELLAKLARATPCEIDAVHFYWPLRERERLAQQGGTGQGRGDDHEEGSDDQLLRATLAGELEPILAPLAALPGEPPRVHLRALMGAQGEPLLADAQERGADLIALGNKHRRSGSTLLATVRAAELPVLCVPAPPPARPAVAEPPHNNQLTARK